MRWALWWVAVWASAAHGQYVVESPHGSEGVWLKGQLHCHSTESDGRQTPTALLEAYRAAGYDFVVLTDHLDVTEVEVEGLVVIPGSEVHDLAAEEGRRWGGHHVGALGVRGNPREWDRSTLGAILERVDAEGGLAVANHPRVRNHWSLEDLLGPPAPDLVSIFNAKGYVVAEETLPGGGEALFARADHWDALWAAGGRAWGIAADDCHDVRGDDFDRGWVWVRAAERTPAAVLAALRAGDVVAGRGAGWAPRLEVEARRLVDGVGWEVEARTEEGAEVRWLVDGEEVARGRGGARYRPTGAEGVLRAEAWQGGARSYGQPLRVVRGARLVGEEVAPGRWRVRCVDEGGRATWVARALRVEVEGLECGEVVIEAGEGEVEVVGTRSGGPVDWRGEPARGW